MVKSTSWLKLLLLTAPTHTVLVGDDRWSAEKITFFIISTVIYMKVMQFEAHSNLPLKRRDWKNMFLFNKNVCPDAKYSFTI